MNKEEIYNVIREWETKAGESLLDQGFDLKNTTYLIWCLGRGYITSKQFNEFMRNTRKLAAIDANYFVYSYYGEDVPWAVVQSDEWNEEDNKKAFMILAEFISEIEVYQERLIKFVEEN